MNGLEHFYYGQLVHHGTPTGENRVLARSKGITDEHVQVALQAVQLPPLDNAPRTAWGIVRGNKEMPFVLVHAQKGSAGQITQHYILLQADLPRLLQGHLKAYLPIIVAQMPTYEMLGDTLPLLGLPSVTPLTLEKQASNLLDLMGYTRNNTKNIEPLLASVITGRTLIVQNAPDDVDTRVGFVQGLLSLIPSSTRFGVTFILHITNSDTNAQIIFCNGTVSDKAVIYDWETGKVQADITNDYSRFIVSQLRLDAEGAIQQAESLTQTAGWRFKNGDKLADALAYASHRSRIDQAVQNNLPVSAEDVSKILADDPTLDDAQRVGYAQHLVNFALALEDISHTEPVALVCSKSPAFAKTVLQQFNTAIESGKASLIFQMLTKWLQNPLSPQTQEWIELLHKSALIELRDIIQARDVESLKMYLGDLLALQGTTLVSRIVPKVIDASIPLSPDDTEIPSLILLLGIGYLDKANFQKLLTVPTLAKYLPKELKRFLSALGNKQAPTPPNTLMDAAKSMGIDNQDDAVMQFAEMAYANERIQLIDTATLSAMTRIVSNAETDKYFATAVNIARLLSDDYVKNLDGTAQTNLLQLFLATRRFDLLYKAMIEQSRDIYGGERQSDYVHMLQDVFALTPLPVNDMRKAIDALREYGVKEIALTCIVCGALQATQYSPELNDLAELATQDITSNPRYMDVIHNEAPLALVNYHLRNRSLAGVQRVALILPALAASKDDKEGLMAIRESYKTLSEHERLQTLAFEVLRQYVRVAQPKPAQRIVEYYSKELDKDTAAKLQRSYNFSVFTDRLSLSAYATAVNITAELLETGYSAYLRDKPTSNQLHGVYENIRVRVDPMTRETLATELLRFGQNIIALGKQMDARNLSAEAITALAKGQENPRTILEIFRVGGGKLLRGKVHQIRLKIANTPNPFGDMPANQLYGNLQIANAVLQLPLEIYPDGKRITWSAPHIHDELDSMLKMMPNDEAQEVATQLGTDWQRVAELIPLLIKDVDLTAMDSDSKVGKKLETQSQLPKNTLEFYRYLIGLMK